MISWRHVLLLVSLLCLQTGCYYAQAVSGQLGVLARRQPIAQVLADSDTPEQLANRLRLVQEARSFSVRELGLPDNDSYRSYADLERDYVVWNIFAAPEFSVTAKQWCYPIAGCVSYRGYFKEAAARRAAEKLQQRGYDVFVGGVAAYSTLGRFDDPVLSTMLRWDDVQLVAVLFHELAHQVLYVKDDTGFNEAFASAVEEFGVERFLASRDSGELYASYLERKALRQQLTAKLQEAREDLRTYYLETLDDDEKRLLKEHRLEQLGNEVRTLLNSAGRNPDAWLALPLNNARLLSVSLYEEHVPAFRAMLANCAEELACFYAEARRISRFERAERDAYLEELATRCDACFGSTTGNSPLRR